MSFSYNTLRNDERAIYSLRELYRRYGYSRYKVGKFEEYDLYAYNKNFLISENILTFTDTNGKLMALKPDVTLSIVKNIHAKDSCTHKLYYNENVYRTSAESHGFKEIMQTGLECIGHIDVFAESEVIMLAIRSLESISGDFVLAVSHMGLIEGLLDEGKLDEGTKNIFLKLVKSKNVASIKKMAAEMSMDEKLARAICELTEMYMPLSSALELIGKLSVGERMRTAHKELCGICEAMMSYGLSDKIYFDFSVVNDFDYYDGVVFKGFINGVPDSVLSGGRYDRLLLKMGKPKGAIGFAVYLDRLERLEDTSAIYDVDVLLIYDDITDVADIINAVNHFTDSGKTVRAVRDIDVNLKYGQLVRLDTKGAVGCETND